MWQLAARLPQLECCFACGTQGAIKPEEVRFMNERGRWWWPPTFFFEIFGFDSSWCRPHDQHMKSPYLVGRGPLANCESQKMFIQC